MESNEFLSVIELEEDIIRSLRSRPGVSEADAHDIWSQIVLKASERILKGAWFTSSGPGQDPDRVRRYVFGMARNEMVNFWRERGTEAGISADELTIVDEAAEQNLARVAGGDEWVAQMLEQLSSRQRQVMELFAFEGMQLNEIAKAMGMTAATARVHLHHARKKLMELMASEEEAL